MEIQDMVNIETQENKTENIMELQDMVNIETQEDKLENNMEIQDMVYMETQGNNTEDRRTQNKVRKERSTIVTEDQTHGRV